MTEQTSPQISPEELQRILDTTAMVDANAQLLLQKTRDLQQRLTRVESCLALVVGLVLNMDGPEGTQVARRLAQQLAICAQDPDMTANIVGCDPDNIDAEILQATADFLDRGGGEFAPDLSLEPAATMH